jgi:hypothetical protein
MVLFAATNQTVYNHQPTSQWHNRNAHIQTAILVTCSAVLPPLYCIWCWANLTVHQTQINQHQGHVCGINQDIVRFDIPMMHNAGEMEGDPRPPANYGTQNISHFIPNHVATITIRSF